MAEKNNIRVVIDNLNGETVREYEGVVTQRDEKRSMVQIETTYDGDVHNLGQATVEPGDRLIIRFYDDRLYNMVYIFDHRYNKFEGWYCNFLRPLEIGEERIHAQDLELALHVLPSENGGIVINRSRFEALDLPAEERDMVENELAYLLQAAAENARPFGTDELTELPADRTTLHPDERLARDPKRDIKLNDPRTDQRSTTEN